MSNLKRATKEELIDLVGGKPDGYDEQIFLIKKRFNENYLKDKDNSDFLLKTTYYIREIPFHNPYWKRKHLYLLLIDLINYYYEHDEDIMYYMYDVRTGIDGEGILDGLPRYNDEPQDDEGFYFYMNNNCWMNP